MRRISVVLVLAASAVALAGCGQEPAVDVEAVVQTPAAPVEQPAPAAPEGPAPAPSADPADDGVPAPGPPPPEPPAAGPEPASEPAQPRTSLQDLFDEVSGPNVKLVSGVSDLAVGENRLSFLVVRDDASLVQTPQARVRIGRIDAVGDLADATAIDGTTLADTAAVLEPLGPHAHPEDEETAPHDHEEADDVYATRVSFPEPGRYWILVDPEGQEIQAYDVVEVRARPLAPAVGDEAYPSENPTLDDGPAESITTARPPDVGLLRSSVAEAIAANVPFVVTFATPAFCVSRVCGPTVEVVDAVRELFAETQVRFIHVEIFEGNDPNAGFNQWVSEWQLPTEPWTFLVDANGVIVERVEGAISVDALARLVDEKLLAR